MEITPILFLVVSIALSISSTMFWSTQKFYKMALVFALGQLAALYFTLVRFDMSMRELMLVSSGFFAIAVIFAMVRNYRRFKRALQIMN
jgi:hypothetical protein